MYKYNFHGKFNFKNKKKEMYIHKIVDSLDFQLQEGYTSSEHLAFILLLESPLVETMLFALSREIERDRAKLACCFATMRC